MGTNILSLISWVSIVEGCLRGSTVYIIMFYCGCFKPSSSPPPLMQPSVAIPSEGRHSPPRSITSPTVSSSVTTLTSDPRQDVSEEDLVPHHPARPSYMYQGHHQTSSSVGSEGFGSLTSEELTLEDLAHQDWSQWSKEVRYAPSVASYHIVGNF